jgi:predicted RNA-binding protein YlxR (DUF448 family)
MVPTRTTTSGPASGGGGNQARARHVPQRTCVACRTTGDQRTFVRLVRTPDGSVQVDEQGKAPGRGAYLCRRPACWERGVKGALASALRTHINATDRDALLAYGARFEAPTATPDEDGADTPPDPPGATESGVA